MAHDWLEELDDSDLIVNGKLSEKDRNKSPQLLLPLALIESVIGMGGIKTLREQQRFCAIVKAPAADWVVPIGHLLRPWGWNFSHGRITPLRGIQISNDTTSQQAVNALSRGGRVLGISQDPNALLPSSMVTAVDMLVDLPQPNGSVIAAVIKRMTGKLPKNLPDDMVISLGFDDICACLRQDETATKCVERLKKAMANRRASDPMTRDVPHVRDLHGYGEAQTWALNLIEDLDAWRRGELPFDEIDANVVLASPPGMGKTTFARSLAHSANLPLVATSVADWFANSPGFLDSVIKQIDRLFEEAKALAPAVVFFDEIDAVPNRATISPRGADWWLPVITHLLTKLDGAVSSTTDRLIIVGATNHPEKLDAALVRPGRLNRIIHIAPPDADAMIGILRQHLGADLAGEDLTQLGQMAAGSSGATAVQWVRTARRTARLAKRPMIMADLLAAIAPADTRSAEVLETTAIHEASHAVIAVAMGLGKIESVSILRRGDSGGSTVLEFDGRIPSRQVVEALGLQLLAGRAGEEVFFGEPGTGSGGPIDSDLARVTRLIGMLYVSEGFGDSLLHLGDQDAVPKVLMRNPEIAAAVQAHIHRLYQEAIEKVRDNRSRIRTVADELLQTRHIGQKRFLEIMAETNIAHEANTKEQRSKSNE